MRKLISIMLIGLLALAAPTALAADQRSQIITQPLDANLSHSLTINAEGVDIVIIPAAAGETPYAELDTTRLRSADRARFDLTVTGEADGQVIDAYVLRNNDGGSARLSIYLNTDNPLSLSLNLVDTDITLRKVSVEMLSGTILDGDFEGEDSTINTMRLTLRDGDLTHWGAARDIDIRATDGDIHIETSELPAGIEIDGRETDVTLRLPAGSGYTLTYEYEDADSDDRYAKGRNGQTTIGSGEAQYHIKLVDGELDLR